jgi:hypothetical protein
LQTPSRINKDNLQNLRHEISRTFRNEKREYLKCKINELETNNKNGNIRDLYSGINELSASCPGHFTPRERAPDTHWSKNLKLKYTKL